MSRMRWYPACKDIKSSHEIQGGMKAEIIGDEVVIKNESIVSWDMCR